MSLHPSACAAIITAAGESSRMGKPKESLAWGVQSLLEHQLECLRSWSQRIVVTGAHDIPKIVNKTWMNVPNPDWRTGRSSSISRGAAAVSGEPQAILIVAIDQPLVPSVLASLLNAFKPAMHTFARPYVQESPGHPVLFSAALRTDLMAIERYENGLRGLIAEYEKWERKVPVADPLVHADLNTPHDYERAHQDWLNRELESEG